MNAAKILGLKDKQALFVLSPHLDDAVWSLGAVLSQLSAGGHEVVVITIFSKTTQTKVRKGEDAGALKEAGCDFRHLNFPDAILDGRPVEDVFDETFVPTAETVEEIVAAVKKIVPADAVVLGPGGFGVHVDHLTTRAVTQALPDTTFYYEDLPYAAKGVRLSNALDFFKSQNIERHTVETTSEMVDAHIRLYNLYVSQRKDAHIDQIRAHLNRVGFGVWGS